MCIGVGKRERNVTQDASVFQVRRIFESGNESDFDRMQFWPHKIGREYVTEPAKYSNPDMPDFSPSWLQNDT